MAYDDRFSDRNRGRGRWREDEQARREWRERETQWQGDDSFSGGWGNQTPRESSDWRGPPERGGDFGPDRGRGGIGSGGPGWGQERGRDPRTEIGGAGSSGFSRIASRDDNYGFGGDYARDRRPERGHDPHYAKWRERQMAALDRDYDEYRREHQTKFDRDFGAWRDTRGRQREAVSRVTEQMEVVGADGAHIGTVDKVRGDSLLLTRKDPDAGGVHHSIPCGWIEKVEDRVILNLDGEGAKKRWSEESRRRALFEREDSGSRGPHMLNRAFSGTYPEER